MENETKFNPSSVDIKLVMIEGTLFEIPSAYYSTMDVELLSKERSYLPDGTVRYIGKIPWKATAIRRERSAITNFLLGFGFHRTYTVRWRQVLPPILSQDEFTKTLFKKI